MNDLIALHIVSSGTEAQSARPGAPVVPDEVGAHRSRQSVRRALAATLRTAASAERRWADRLDPACTPAPARG
jgi:hypothetical protein